MKDNAYLKEKAGHEVVKVEQRSSPAVGFGTGLPKVTMPFGHLVDQIASGADQYYLTTQYEEVAQSSTCNDGWVFMVYLFVNLSRNGLFYPRLQRRKMAKEVKTKMTKSVSQTGSLVLCPAFLLIFL